MKNWTFFITTFGCKVNQYESQALREAWCSLGGTERASPAGVDAALINSCAVTAKAERDARNALYRLRREAPNAHILLSGCAALRVSRLLGEFPHILIPQEKKNLLLLGPWSQEAQCLQEAQEAHGVRTPQEPSFHIADFTRARPVIKIQDGCSRFCAYCIVPLTRGPARSRDPADIFAEAEGLLNAGFQELMLSGINLSQYTTPAAPDFYALLRLLEKKLAPGRAGAARLRISSLYPEQLDERMLEHFAHSVLLCPHLHLSLQSGSPEILRRMGRGDTDLERLAAKLRQLRACLPHLGLGADLLAGFPGESEAQFLESLHCISALNLTYAHIFSYSSRPGTAAADMPDQIPQREKARRACLLREAAEAQHTAFLRELLQEPVLHLLPNGMNAKGREAHYAPCLLLGPPPAPRKILPVRPVRVENGSLLTVRIETEAVRPD